MNENTVPHSEHTGWSEPIIDNDNTNDRDKEDKDEETHNPDQDLEDTISLSKEMGSNAPEPITTAASESDDEESAQDDKTSVPGSEKEVHSSGYNLRKRKDIDYSETRKYNTTATVLYQYGKLSEVKENLITKLNQREALEP